jgi:hypothetical protein
LVKALFVSTMKVKPISSVELSVQVKLTWLLDTAVATRLVGAFVAAASIARNKQRKAVAIGFMGSPSNNPCAVHPLCRPYIFTVERAAIR